MLSSTLRKPSSLAAATPVGKGRLLAEKTKKLLKKLLLKIAKSELDLELKRQYLASNEHMEPYALFTRIDRNADGFISPMELLHFLRDNNVHDMTEADCYYTVKFFDADEDGRLHFPDFMQLVLPCDNNVLRATATQRPNTQINPGDFLTLDVERDLAALLVAEIELHRGSEKVKQQLESQPDYSSEAVYQCIDDWGYGFVDTRNLYRFFKNCRSKATEEDCVALIRRFDLDADSKLSRDEFLGGIKAQEPFSKMIVREKMAKREERLAAVTKAETRNPSAKRATTKGKTLPLAEENWNN
jgi:Ca2+-binding EF-hand superfamily protein